MYKIIALSEIGTQITLSSYKQNSLQGDSVLAEIYKDFGVETVFKNNSIKIIKKQKHETELLKIDFLNCPDIAQTLACTCLGLAISFEFTGLQTLKIKETDRIIALQKEFLKFNKTLLTTQNSLFFDANQKSEAPIKPIIIDTYNDHRMAMAFAPLCLVQNEIQINNADIVSKSYPTFWEDLEKIGVCNNYKI